MAPWQGAPHSGGVRTTLSSVVNQRAFSNSCGLPLATLVDFLPATELSVQRLPRAPVQCPTCHAFLNQFCRVNFDQGQWECVMCGSSSTADAGILGSGAQATLELCTEAVEYTTQPAQPVPAGGPPEPKPHVVIVVDTNIERSQLANLRQALPAAIHNELGPDTLVSVIGCDAVASLWLVGADSGGQEAGSVRVEAHTLPGETAMDQASVASVNRNSGLYWAPLGKAKDALDATLGALRPLHTHLPVLEAPRCLAVCIEVGLRLLAASAHAQASALPAIGSRVLVVTSGPTTVGPCSVPLSVLDHVGAGPAAGHQQVEGARLHMLSLVKMAASLTVPIDIMAVTSPCVHVALLADMADQTGGLFSYHDGNSPVVQHALQAALGRGWGTQGVLDCHVSPGLRVTHWLGPVNDLHDRIKEGSVPKGVAGASCASPAACYVGHLSMGQGAIARMELTKDLTVGSNTHVQVVLHYRDVDTGARVVRVVTKRVRVVGTVAELLQGVDAVAASADIAKRLVCDAITATAHRHPKALAAARSSCAAALTLLASRFGRQQASGGVLGLGSRRATQLAVPLLYVASSLYALQRGRILGLDNPQEPGGVIHPEERLLLMRTLLCASAQTCATFANPPLYALLPCAPPSTQGTAPAAAQPPAAGQSPTEAPTATVTDPLHTAEGAVAAPAGGAVAASAAYSGRQHHRLVPLPSLDLVLAAAQHAAGAAVQLGSSSPDSRLPCLVLDLGSRLVLLDCAVHPDAATGEQLHRAAARQLPALAGVLQGEELPVHLLQRSPVPDLVATHVLAPLTKDIWPQLIHGGLSPVQYSQPKQRLVQLMDAAFSAANIELGQFNTVVSEGALPWLFTTAVQLANGSLGTWHQAELPKGKLTPGKTSFLQYCGELGIVLPTTA